MQSRSHLRRGKRAVSRVQWRIMGMKRSKDMIDMYEYGIIKLIIVNNEYILIKMHGYKKEIENKKDSLSN